MLRGKTPERFVAGRVNKNYYWALCLGYVERFDLRTVARCIAHDDRDSNLALPAILAGC
jgi:hypothetical protein